MKGSAKHATRVLNKNRKIVVVCLLAVLIFAFSPQILTGLSTIGNTYVPGPEGLTARLHGVEVNGLSMLEGKRENGFHPVFTMTAPVTNGGVISAVNNSAPNTWIAYSDTVYVNHVQAVNQARLGLQWKVPQGTSSVIELGSPQLPDGLKLKVETSRPTQDQLNRAGSPFPTSTLEQLNWFSYYTDFSQTPNHATWKSYEVYIIPVDFVVQLSVLPTNNNIGGYFKDVTLWLVLDTNVWYNAFTENQMIQSATAPTDSVVTAYNYRGGFPIWSWVGAWDPFVLTGNKDTSFNYAYELFGKGGVAENKYTIYDGLTVNQLAGINSYTDVTPSFSGREVELYHNPQWQYENLYSQEVLNNPELLKTLMGNSIGGLPDARFATTVYTPITLNTFGAYHETTGTWWLGTEDNNYFYPASYMRIRVLYAVYGEWSYLWNAQEAERVDYVWENRTSNIVLQPGILNSFLDAAGNWLSNPFNQLWIVFILVVVVLIVVTVLNPQMWSNISQGFNSRQKSEGYQTVSVFPWSTRLGGERKI